MPVFSDIVLLLPGQERPFAFKVLYKDERYCFCECPENPALRGFFTREFVGSVQAYPVKEGATKDPKTWSQIIDTIL